MARRLTLAVERFPIAGAFTISRGSRTEIAVVVATIADGDAVGRGECVPYPRYGESVESVAETDAISPSVTRTWSMTCVPWAPSHPPPWLASPHQSGISAFGSFRDGICSTKTP